MPADRWKIITCLALLKKTTLGNLIIAGRSNPNSKTTRCLRSLGYTAKDVLGVIHSLELEDYSEGPLMDNKGRPHDLWVFGKMVEGLQIYIKVVPVVEADEVTTICVSFHEAEYEMSFPLRRA